MTIPSKVLWGEGLFLRPQHFQQQDRYHEARLNQVALALQPFLWGVRRIEWDLDALKADRLRLQALSLIFRDGEIFDAPGSEPLPPAVDLAALPAALQEVTWYAALPALAPGGGNAAGTTEHHPGARYRDRKSTRLNSSHWA